MKSVVVRLAACPGVITEGPVVAMLAYFLLGLPFLWALMLGFILGTHFKCHSTPHFIFATSSLSE